MHTILVLGGYGFFGSRICRTLAEDRHIRLLIAGRNGIRAQALACELNLQPDQAYGIDAYASNLAERLRALHVDTLIHTAGPFQGQDYSVAQAAIAAGANYIDLADARQFVSGITQLDESARQCGVFVTSGASSLPALSSAVVDRYAQRFSRLESICHGIASGARSPGLATMQGVFGYCGKPIKRWESGCWQTTYGWLDLQRHQFPKPVGTRLLGSCDVPDLDLFVQRYPGIRTVTFHAGFASNWGHRVVWGLAQLTRLNYLSSVAPFAKPLHMISQWLEPFVSDKGGMFVKLAGIGLDGQPLKLTWNLIAAQNHGPHIPCGASIALARKLAKGVFFLHGAMPCMGLLTVEDYLSALQSLDIQELRP